MEPVDLERIIPEQETKFQSRKFLLIAAFVIVKLIIIVIILAALLGSKRTSDSQVVCTTSECLRMSGFLADNMVLTVDPCQDFHKFACGGFRNRHHLAPDETEVTMIEILENEVDERLREMIENPVGASPRTTSEEKLRSFFLSCVHEYGRNSEGGRVLVGILREKLGGIYILDPENWSESWNMQDALARVQGDLIVDVFFEAYMQRNFSSGRNNLVLYPAGIEMWHSNYEENESAVQDSYKDYMRRIAVLLIRDANVTVTSSAEAARVEQFVRDVFDWESQLATKLRILYDEGTLYKGISTTVGELDRNFTQLNWLNTAQRMFEDLAVTEDTRLYLYGPAYYSTVIELILNDTEGNQMHRVMNNFLLWKVANRFASHLSWEYQESKRRFLEAMYGEEEPEPTWKTCLNTVRTRLGTLLATEFIRAHLGPDVKTQVAEMASDIRTALVERIPDLHWMDAATQQKAIERVRATIDIIGYSEMYYNETVMEQLHSMLEIDRSAGYFRNLLNLNRFQRRMRTQLLLEKESAFIDHLPLFGGYAHYWIEPYYIDYYNTLLVPAGSMLDPVYNAKRPQVFNYGILGSLLAEQLLHVVGYSGRFSLINGRYRVWWSNKTSFEYNKTTQCFVRYFDDLVAGPFQIDDANLTVSVKGILQTKKLMEDYGGIRTAYRAYKDWTAKNGQESLSPGISLTHDQFFFVASAQTKCYLRKDEDAYNLAKQGYLPEELELNSLLKHMPEFSNAFNCPVGSNMRSDNQCQIY